MSLKTLNVANGGRTGTFGGSHGARARGTRGTDVHLQDVEGVFRGCLAKSQKIGTGTGKAHPHPSKKKSFSVAALLRKTAIEPQHSNYLVKFFTFD